MGYEYNCYATVSFVWNGSELCQVQLEENSVFKNRIKAEDGRKRTEEEKITDYSFFTPLPEITKYSL